MAGPTPDRPVGAAAMPAQALLRPSETLFSAAWRALLRHRSGMVGLLITLTLLILALSAPLLAPYDPLEMHAADKLSPPSRTYLLGTDEFGRDLFSRVLYGGRVAFSVGTIAVVMASILGVSIGLVTGYTGGWLDAVSMRFFDALLAFPAILLAIVILAVLGPGIFNAMLAVAIVNIPVFGRLTRANVLSEKHREYVEAARAVGAPPGRILFRTLLPNILATLLVQATVSFAEAVLLESSLSFLGLGVPLPAPSWGSMLSIGRGYMLYSPWYAIAPGTAIMLLVLGVYLLGDGLRDVLDPRRQKTL
ncbi:ABC transporter permease [Litorilinea aerophila]|nr:ABC transporter permease [Litorilinea aerophila]MCC9076869.1 ABC transporter permease [Litorilinea aerophila]